MNVIIFGPPGVGKGTQSKRIQEAYGLCHVSTGDILRREIAKKSKTGLEAEQHVTRGEMVPDELIIRLVKRRLANDVQCQRNGWLLDGFPRTARQANGHGCASTTATATPCSTSLTSAPRAPTPTQDPHTCPLARGPAAARSHASASFRNPGFLDCPPSTASRPSAT